MDQKWGLVTRTHSATAFMSLNGRHGLASYAPLLAIGSIFGAMTLVKQSMIPHATWLPLLGFLASSGIDGGCVTCATHYSLAGWAPLICCILLLGASVLFNLGSLALHSYVRRLAPLTDLHLRAFNGCCWGQQLQSHKLES